MAILGSSSSSGAGGDGGLGEAITGQSSAGQLGRLPLNFSGGSSTAEMLVLVLGDGTHWEGTTRRRVALSL